MREAEVKDAPALARLMNDLEKESNFLLFEPNERQMSAKQAEQMIQNFNSKENSTVWLAFDEGRVIGHVTCIGGGVKRNAHCAKVVAGIQRDQQGKGIASSLLERVKEWAVHSGIHRLELSVMVHNEAAFHVYKKAGFEVEGRLKHSLCVDGNWIDEYMMALLLS
ncbi:GNAT family N-acetyltransferase [Halobacillus locisalis]|uniref:GNAT family N-acetyltransferase n=1 Tax=Halobacillus locisalis TaxID=220753 RepID=A0A838CRC5_9BACI|nr:GNAT family protein [Halobacillus locisalis]MBA2174627.1 GNAT family N-acetyltransferase [Halobacillus locisalis]